MPRQERDNSPRIDYDNPQFQRSLSFTGGIDKLVGEVKRRQEKGEDIQTQAARLSKRIAKHMTKEEAAEAQDAFHGSSRLLADAHNQKTEKYLGISRESDLVNATNVFDTALDYASGRHQIPEHIQKKLKRKR